MKEPQFCIVARDTSDKTSLGVVIKETLYEGQAKLLAIRYNNTYLNVNFWAMHYNDCINLKRATDFYKMPESIL